MTTDADQWLDILEPRKKSSDFLWTAFHDYKFSQYNNSKRRKPDQIKQDVLKEPIIEFMLKSDSRLRSRIEDILTEMCHNFSLRHVRFFGYFSIKIVKSIYKSILVNNYLNLSSSSIYMDCRSPSLSLSLNKLSENTPILYVPTHRSYADFILFSFVCFSLDLPLPSIAAAIDFLGMKQIASLMRSCGAFFIRRSFKSSSDTIYFQVFRAYLQSQIRGGERPLEFFIEGTRSRTGKSNYPRTGVLSVALELYFTGQIPDLLIIPISISYDRIIEECLYAEELLSFDDFTGKPAETPSNLLTAVKAILNQNFGSVYIRFCQPISVRELDEGNKFKLCHSLDSRYDMNITQTSQELDFVLNLSKSIIKVQQMNAVFTPFTFASLIFLSYCDSSEASDVSISIISLLQDIETFSSLMNMKNLSFDKNSLEKQLYESFKVHSNILIISEDKLSVIINTKDPIKRVLIQQYANQAMQLLNDFAIILYSRGNYHKFERIKFFLSWEFIYSPSQMTEADILTQFFSESSLTDRVRRALLFQIDYYIKNYKLITEFLKHYKFSSYPIDKKNLIKVIQKEVNITCDIIRNYLSVLSNCGALVRHSDNNMEVNVTNINKIGSELIQLSNNIYD